MSISRIRQYLLPIVFTLAVLSLIWRNGNILPIGAVKPFEILLALAFVLALFDFTFSPMSRSILRKLKPVWVLYGLLFGAFTLFAMVGHGFSAISFPNWASYASEVYLEYARFIFVFLLFFLTVYIVVRYAKSVRWILSAIVFSPIVLFLAFVPRLQDFFVEDARLIGARNDPNYLATFLALGLIIAAAFFLYTRSRLKWLGVVYIVVMSPLFLWAHSRAAFLSIAVALIILSAIYVIRERSFIRIGLVGILGTIFILSNIFSFFVLPNTSQALIYRRSIANVFPSETLRGFMADFTSQGDTSLHTAVLRNIPTDTFDISRGELWRDALNKSVRSPLGFGPAYHNWSPIGDIGRPHNLFLEVVLTAGWIGFFAFLIFVGLVFLKLSKIMRGSNWVGIALGTSFVYLLLNGLFLDMLTLRWLWLIMGLIVGYAFLEGDENTESISAATHL